MRISNAILAAGMALAVLPGQVMAAKASTDPAVGRGPYRVVMTEDPSLPHHVIYRPADLAAFAAKKLPILVWGEGGCADGGNRYRYFLSDIASRGYLVIALGKIGPASDEHGWPGEPVLPPTPPDVHSPAPTNPEEMTQAIDWAIAQDTRTGAALDGKVATDKVAVAGHSCGGLQALQISSTDPRITTTMLLNSGVWSMGTGGLPGAPDVTKDSLNHIHGSIMFLNGEGDIALSNAKDDFSRLKGIPAFRADRKGVVHAGTYWLPHGGAFATVAGEWLDWQLKGDKHASRWFVGADCRLCTDPRWQAQSKDLH